MLPMYFTLSKLDVSVNVTSFSVVIREVGSIQTKCTGYMWYIGEVVLIQDLSMPSATRLFEVQINHLVNQNT